MENNTNNLYTLRAEMDSLEDRIKKEKNRQNQLSIEGYTEVFLNEIRDGNALNEKLIKSILKDLVKEVVTTERVI